MDTMLIQLTNAKAAGLLHELERLNLIKVLKENITAVKPKLSDKYKGILTKKDKNLMSIFNRCVANGTVFN